jgi:hypothetical protein
VHHAGVTVADLDGSPAFYRDVLGDGYTVELFQPPGR